MQSDECAIQNYNGSDVKAQSIKADLQVGGKCIFPEIAEVEKQEKQPANAEQNK
jgi:hypothetical protein